MSTHRFTIEDAFRELNRIVEVVAVTTNASDGRSRWRPHRAERQYEERVHYLQRSPERDAEQQ